MEAFTGERARAFCCKIRGQNTEKFKKKKKTLTIITQIPVVLHQGGDINNRHTKHLLRAPTKTEQQKEEKKIT